MPPNPSAEWTFGGYYHDAPRAVSSWPLHAWPNVQTGFVLCKDDRVFPAALFRGLVRERLNIAPDEIPGGHCVALSRPKELADLLVRYA